MRCRVGHLEIHVFILRITGGGIEAPQTAYVSSLFQKARCWHEVPALAMALASIRGNPAHSGSTHRMRYAGVPPNELYNCSRRLWPGRGRARGFSHSQFGEDNS